VFLPGQEDIDGLRLLLLENLPLSLPNYLKSSEVKAHEHIQEESRRRPDTFVIHTLYAAMSPEQQLKAFELPPPGVRKFVLSTNIAETSVTIPGITYVVDPGLVKVKSLQTNTGIDMLRVIPVSQSQANQRAGRAGRECPGKCFRLYRDVEFDKLELCAMPEIQRISMAQVLLQLISMGIQVPLFLINDIFFGY
jgi:ATP-dependent RNA helicase DHX8/PRP22